MFLSLPFRVSVFPVVLFVKYWKGGVFINVTLGIFLAGVGFMDFRYGKVSNIWLWAGAILGVFWVGYPFFLPSLVTLCVTFFLFRMKAMGGADGKIMGILIGYLGFEQGTILILLGILVASLWSMITIVRSAYLKTYLSSMYACVLHLIHNKNLDSFTPIGTIPFGTCLSIGGLVYYIIYYSYVKGW